MIEVLPESEGNVLGVRASDTLTDDDYRNTWIPRLEALIQKHGQVRALLYMDEGFKGWSAGALWDDARFGVRHASDFDKVAVVGGPDWAAWGARLVGHLMKGDVKSFPGDQLQPAWDWIKS